MEYQKRSGIEDMILCVRVYIYIYYLYVGLQCMPILTSPTS